MLAPSVGVFKKMHLSIIRPLVLSTFGINNPAGLSYPTQLRVGLSKLNFYKFKYNFKPGAHSKIFVAEDEDVCRWQ